MFSSFFVRICVFCYFFFNFVCTLRKLRVKVDAHREKIIIWVMCMQPPPHFGSVWSKWVIRMQGNVRKNELNLLNHTITAGTEMLRILTAVGDNVKTLQ